MQSLDAIVGFLPILSEPQCKLSVKILFPERHDLADEHDLQVLSAISQEAYVWASVAEASKRAMEIRYSLLPYMYTLFYYASTTGSTVMRAL